MENLVSLILFFGTGFAVALGAAWLFIRITLYLRTRLDPSIGDTLRVRAASGMYRSRLLGLGRSSWTLSAPLQRDAFVPIRIGEELVIESASRQGALLFRSQVVARDPETHSLHIQRPERIHLVERRGHRRFPELEGAAVQLEGESATLMDISEGGARLHTSTKAHRGDRVRLDLPSGDSVFAWVLSTDGCEARLRFEELMMLGK